MHREPSRRIDWWWIAKSAFLLLLTVYSLAAVRQMLVSQPPTPHFDWINLEAAAKQANPYAAGPAFRWSPIAAWLLAPVVAIGWYALVVGHFAVLLLLRDRRLIGILLIAWPFWVDVLWGNLVTVAFVATYLALTSSNRLATWVFFGVCMLVPRPLMLPALFWILWRRPSERLPFLGLLTANSFIVVATGLADDWIARLLVSNEISHVANYAPSALIGPYWVPAGILLAGVLTWRGYVGWASLAVQPYLLPYYFLFALLPGGVLGGRRLMQERPANWSWRAAGMPLPWVSRSIATRDRY